MGTGIRLLKGAGELPKQEQSLGAGSVRSALAGWESLRVMDVIGPELLSVPFVSHQIR